MIISANDDFMRHGALNAVALKYAHQNHQGALCRHLWGPTAHRIGATRTHSSNTGYGYTKEMLPHLKSPLAQLSERARRKTKCAQSNNSGWRHLSCPVLMQIYMQGRGTNERKIRTKSAVAGRIETKFTQQKAIQQNGLLGASISYFKGGPVADDACLYRARHNNAETYSQDRASLTPPFLLLFFSFSSVNRARGMTNVNTFFLFLSLLFYLFASEFVVTFVFRLLFIPLSVCLRFYRLFSFLFPSAW